MIGDAFFAYILVHYIIIRAALTAQPPNAECRMWRLQYASRFLALTLILQLHIYRLLQLVSYCRQLSIPLSSHFSDGAPCGRTAMQSRIQTGFELSHLPHCARIVYQKRSR